MNSEIELENIRNLCYSILDKIEEDERIREIHYIKFEDNLQIDQPQTNISTILPHTSIKSKRGKNSISISCLIQLSEYADIVTFLRIGGEIITPNRDNLFKVGDKFLFVSSFKFLSNDENDITFILNSSLPYQLIRDVDQRLLSEENNVIMKVVHEHN